jgi:chromosome segregation and condensation protein ScpB
MTDQARAAVELEPELRTHRSDDEVEGTREISATELKGITESLIFVADEPIDSKFIAKVLRVEQRRSTRQFNRWLKITAIGRRIAVARDCRRLADFDSAEHHEYVRAYLKSKPARSCRSRRWKRWR